MRLRMPNGYRIAPHVHPKTERLTVISGTFRFGMGAKFDEKALKDLPAGTYAFWPAGMQHFVQARGETVVQLHGVGPRALALLRETTPRALLVPGSAGGRSSPVENMKAGGRRG